MTEPRLTAAMVAAAGGSWADRIGLVRPRCVLELGTGQGAGAAQIMAALPPGAELFTINYPHPSEYAFGEQLAPWRGDPRLHELVADTIDPRTLDLVPRRVDLLFIDSTHEAWHAALELRMWQEKLRDGTVVICDDLNQHDMAAFWDSIPYDRATRPGSHQGIFVYDAARPYAGAFPRRDGTHYCGASR